MARLNDEEIDQRLAGLEGWSRRRRRDLEDLRGRRLHVVRGLVNRLAPVAEEMNHHPDLEISWNKVTVTISTHSEGGLTENDFVLAGKIDGVA